MKFPRIFYLAPATSIYQRLVPLHCTIYEIPHRWGQILVAKFLGATPKIFSAKLP